MIFHRVLNHIFSSYTNIAVLRALSFSKTGLTGREIARNCGISPKSALIALTNLENLHIVKRVIGGRDHIFTLNTGHYFVSKGITPLLNTELNFLPDILSLIKSKLSKKTISIILFGSVARKEEDIDSDLDICMIVKDKSQKTEVEKIKSELFTVISDKYGATISAILFTENEFRKRGLKNLSPINNIIKEGRLISGKPIKILLYGPKK